MRYPIFIYSLILFISFSSFGQGRRTGDQTITYEELYDKPYELNKLFVHFQPVYGDFYASSINAGFAMEVDYLHEDRFDVEFQIRKAYSKATDFSKKLADEQGDNSDLANNFTYLEFGGHYHIIDKEEDTETIMVLYSKHMSSGNNWATKVADKIKIPSKVRKVYGARAGVMSFKTSVDLSRAALDQGVDLSGVDTSLVLPIANDDLNIFGNLNVAGIYIGGNMSLIKNFAIEPEGHSIIINDLIFNTYLDIIIAPSLALDNIVYQDRAYSTENIKLRSMGFRAGMEGKFNREFAFGYGAEIGYRPGVVSRNFFALVKMSFPIFSTNLDDKKEAFSK